jgi:hypothetical protein
MDSSDRLSGGRELETPARREPDHRLPAIPDRAGLSLGREDQMVVEIRRYLGNTLSSHIHDADHEHPNCHLGQISDENRLWYDSLDEARSDHNYEACSWCMSGANDRRSVGAATATGTA